MFVIFSRKRQTGLALGPMITHVSGDQGAHDWQTHKNHLVGAGGMMFPQRKSYWVYENIDVHDSASNTEK